MIELFGTAIEVAAEVAVDLVKKKKKKQEDIAPKGEMVVVEAKEGDET